MSVYRLAWLTVTCTLGAAGIVLTFLTLPVIAVVDAAIAGALVGAVAGAVARYWLANRPVHAPRQVSVRVRLGVGDVATASVAGAGLGLALAGNVGLLGPPALGVDVLACAALAVSSPHAIRRYAGGGSSTTEPAPAPQPPPASTAAAPPTPQREAPPREPTGDGSALRSLSYAELCRAWQESYGDLTGDVTGTSRLAATRAAYLDEIERRDPKAFARWLADVSRAAVDPASVSPDLSPKPPRQPDDPGSA